MFLLVLLFSLLVATVAVQNTTPVTLRVLVFELRDVALSVLVLISIALGAGLALLLGLGTWIGNVRAVRQRDGTIARLQAELARAGAAPPPASVEPPPQRMAPALGDGDGAQRPEPGESRLTPP